MSCFDILPAVAQPLLFFSFSHQFILRLGTVKGVHFPLEQLPGLISQFLVAYACWHIILKKVTFINKAMSVFLNTCVPHVHIY
jgi:hypothetical protein